jgi:hypothetical protein
MSTETVCRICGKVCFDYPCAYCHYNGDGYEQPINKRDEMSFETWWSDQDRIHTGENSKKVCKIIWERIEVSNHSKLKALEAKNEELEKKLEIVRDCAVRYLDAEDMAAKRTCDKELLKALAAIKDSERLAQLSTKPRC